MAVADRLKREPNSADGLMSPGGIDGAWFDLTFSDSISEGDILGGLRLS